MRTRKSPRKPINVPGRYFTGLGSPVDVTLSDLSEGGCRFVAGAHTLTVGAPLQIYVADSGPHRAAVRWIEGEEVGVTFAAPIAIGQFDTVKTAHGPELPDQPAPRALAPMPTGLPQRFC
ncbi:PilZ domain-containing protein [Erythrobacter sp. JK5]|uniref:PilZ domain-containing protein n=1 Tax=Erythrobacter sp. JK5 TaxID=2829500 RepID=UPI001BA804D8|nr:PilZ domain-containing protein [Erythrobacter sp. JK5]QUL37029.1 PilZ domain-containing protein [Erythrobacter sp. JK5]